MSVLEKFLDAINMNDDYHDDDDLFDEEDEKDLENDINDFLDSLEGEVVDIKYQVSIGVFSEEQVFCFSAMIVYY